MITPTIGRIVWFTPGANLDDRWDVAQPLAAIVTYVWSDRMVNLCVFDPNGRPKPVTSVPLLQDDDSEPALGYFCSWMPYQKGQAAKTEALERTLTQG